LSSVCLSVSLSPSPPSTHPRPLTTASYQGG